MDLPDQLQSLKAYSSLHKDPHPLTHHHHKPPVERETYRQKQMINSHRKEPRVQAWGGQPTEAEHTKEATFAEEEPPEKNSAEFKGDPGHAWALWNQR